MNPNLAEEDAKTWQALTGQSVTMCPATLAAAQELPAHEEYIIQAALLAL